MEISSHIRRYENMHIAFWLVKDTCWMMQYKLLGVCMIVPTVLVAVHIAWTSRRHPDFILNLAILFWITANSYWMVVEFFFHDAHKHLALVPFCAGLLCVAIYYVR